MNVYHLQTHRSTILVIVVWFSMMQTDPRCGKIRAYIHLMHVIWDRWGVHATNIVICRCWIWITHITGRVCARATEISMSNCSYERRLLNVIYFPFNLFWKTDGISQMNVCGVCRKWVWHFNKILFMYEEKKRIQDFHDARAVSIWMRILSLGLIVLRVRFDRLLNFRILSRVCVGVLVAIARDTAELLLLYIHCPRSLQNKSSTVFVYNFSIGLRVLLRVLFVHKRYLLSIWFCTIFCRGHWNEILRIHNQFSHRLY